MSQGSGRDAPAPPADRQKAMQVEQLQVYKQCQFILKPRPTETLHVSAGEIICRFILTVKAEDWASVLMHSGMLCCRFRVASEAI